jgi:NAD(P)-dependent dehydrogenase (short-subunit alcohol dehydrogenase family)
VVTGGGSGIGRGLALTWAAEGMNVVVADVRTEPAERVADEIRTMGRQATAVQCDVANPESVAALAEESFARFGTVDLLCNNAGVGTFGSLLDATPDDWKWIFSVNLFGMVHGIAAFVPRMRLQSGPAHIVNTGSASAITAGNFGNGVYVASKAAVMSLTERLRKELEPDGIGVSLLLASRVTTSIHETSLQNRPAELGPMPEHRPDPVSNDAATLVALDPLVVGRIVRDGVRANRAYIHTDRALRAGMLERNANMVEAFAFLDEARA